ncbi:MAG: 1-deoxy-D-xylulose-5-phosphate reductoisomerase [Deltaproteobacteria bacterium CG_4_10_14_0_2_um_filter_43_8]|nr:MAG: 1-deoxy-D-xylulose-5-phosphate reductoisomerase [Deltaproteobacteria bacterium CG11_big_fil_rev_8_21_14_0_20_42_23]PJA18732.1 MAG: 1-deoxy-D-xylulose-5-phosphate reductoisomerase [Deltaproteobacteria bacterium CG_4_10_14_0_2_um_filter_43_8]PJC64398.1 MAG: 1-deoxy-D-xylulose-5-phosphate reductoisomerase [Deltaproteobacteria bacterium CG_4_9_14_0_2_um_filter_42_21]
MTKKKISILGCTGSIGTSTLDVIQTNQDAFEVVGLACGNNIELLLKQIETFKPQCVSVSSEEAAKSLKQKITSHLPEILYGIEGVCTVASSGSPDLVVSAIVGAAGLRPTLAALEAGINVGLANKEALVVAGNLVTATAEKKKLKLLPIDSEHSALFQSLVGHNAEDISHITLTASGGPFRTKTLTELNNVSAAEALKHPNWNMGAKITIDSASMMNKGLEVIEAAWLFKLPPEKIKVVVHPQSIVHSFIEYIDGCVIAELGLPDMRSPIAYALAYPHRIPSGVKTLDLASIATLTFEAPDTKRFPCLQLAYDALNEGGTMSAVLNAANEIAVDAFLKGKIAFLEIATTIHETMNAHNNCEASSLDEILSIDAWARTCGSEYIQRKQS